MLLEQRVELSKQKPLPRRNQLGRQPGITLSRPSFELGAHPFEALATCSGVQQGRQLCPHGYGADWRTALRERALHEIGHQLVQAKRRAHVTFDTSEPAGCEQPAQGFEQLPPPTLAGAREQSKAYDVVEAFVEPVERSRVTLQQSQVGERGALHQTLTFGDGLWAVVEPDDLHPWMTRRKPGQMSAVAAAELQDSAVRERSRIEPEQGRLHPKPSGIGCALRVTSHRSQAEHRRTLAMPPVEGKSTRRMPGAPAVAMRITQTYDATMTPAENELGQPIGAPLPGWVPPPPPPLTTMAGRFCRLEPLEVERHGDDLYEAIVVAKGAAHWTYLPYGPFASAAEFRQALVQAASTADALFFSIVSQASGQALGLAAYHRISLENGAIEVGHLNYGRPLARTPAATEAMYLMMKRAFELGYRRYEWKCDALNAASRRAAERLGFRYEGIFRQAQVYKGRSRDTAWYSVIDGEWPLLRDAFERWLSPNNFDEHGQQRASFRVLGR